MYQMKLPVRLHDIMKRNLKGLFTRTVKVPVSIKVTVKVYHCGNDDGAFDRTNGSTTHSDTIKMFIINTMLMTTSLTLRVQSLTGSHVVEHTVSLAVHDTVTAAQLLCQCLYYAILHTG